MKELLKTPGFGSGETEMFLYESESNTNRVILLLKGIYGYHFQLNDFQTDLLGLKWDTSFIRYFLPYSHIVCVNTSRLVSFDQSNFKGRQDSFEGKDYWNEVSDVSIAFQRALQVLAQKGVTNPEIHLIGKSFGGTTFLGMREIVNKALTISMIGSGCGKSDKTTKPLLRTLPGEQELLKTIAKYTGCFYLYRGELDEVVPFESQEKIIRTSGAKVTNCVTIKGVDHEFEKINGRDSIDPGVIIRKMIFDAIMMNTKQKP